MIKFWEEHPALLFGISFLIGSGSFLHCPFPFNWIWPIGWIGYLLFLRNWPPIALLLGAILYSQLNDAQIEQGSLALFSPSSLQHYQTPFTKGFIYKGMLTIDTKRVPCSIHVKENPPSANCDYIVEGTLKKQNGQSYFFKVNEWTPVPKTWSLAQFRFDAKERIRQFFKEKLKGARVASFLSSLLTGDVEERSLRFEFTKLGLQHILAISGFHFAILISFCSFFLNLIMRAKYRLITLLLLIHLYFIFVGSVPAVQRAYLVTLFFLIGKLTHRHASPLNLLGAAMLVELILDPTLSSHLGFQLSFLSCIGILQFRPFFAHFIEKWLPDHKNLTPLSMHGYLVSRFIKEALVTTIAVNGAILPLLLWHFHSFPFLSLIYNLFFPFLVSVSLLLVLLSIIAHLFSPFLSAPLWWPK